MSSDLGFDPLQHFVAESEGTPYLVMNLARVEHAYQELTAALPNAQIHYAMKCNPDDAVLRCLRDVGSGFEVASSAELKSLVRLGVDARTVLFSSPVKIPRDVEYAVKAGTWRFAFDSIEDLEKLAKYAPGSSVYVRLAVTTNTSEVPSEGKFGISATEASELLRYAKRLGLDPFGITFHVGSQTTDAHAWAIPLGTCGAIMRELALDGIRLRMIDIGGGFPAQYDQPVPSLAEFGSTIKRAVRALPYDVDIVAEPGRALVAEAGVLVATVIGTARRNGRKWVHLDVGAFNGMMESLETNNQLRFPLRDSLNSDCVERCHVTGPSCDSQDTILYDVELSAELSTGDLVFICNAGAYTTSYASSFNGFRIPSVHSVADAGARVVS